MSVSSVFSSIIIDGNIISPSYINGGSGPVIKNYNNLVYVAGDSIITNNVFSGVKNSGNHIIVAGGSSNITKNNFIRGTTSIGSYITVTSTNDQVINDNIFDSPTVDGTNEALVTGLTDNSIYEKNKNQTKYTSTVFNEPIYPIAINSSSFAYAMFVDTSSTTTYNNITGLMVGSIPTTTAASKRSIKLSKNLSHVLPQNVKIIGSVIGYNMQGVGSNVDQTLPLTVTGSLNVSAIDLATAYSNPAFSGSIAYTGNLNQISSTTITYSTPTDYSGALTPRYIISDYSLLPSAVISDGANVVYGLTIVYTSTTAVATTTYFNSPLIIKYRW